MDTERLLVCLEFQIEVQELKKLGLTDEEIEGFFEFDWDIGKDLFTSLAERSADVQH